MKNIKFSIITPVHVWNEDRKAWLYRAIESVKNQTYDNFEMVLINDGSVLDIDVPKYKWLKVLNQPHNERVIAYNLGFREAKGDWFCLLDSDDEYAPNYLEKCAEFIRSNPGYEIFNFGCKYVHKDGKITLREAFTPKELEKGHEIFSGGNIVNCTFIWSRKVYEQLGGFPKDHINDIDCSDLNYGGVRNLFMGSPYDFSAYAQIEFPELRQFFMVKHPDHPKELVRELGNPWGQDYYLFYKYTRIFHCKPILENYLYIVHPR